MNLSRAKMEVGFAVDNFKSSYKNDKSGESIKQSWEFIISQLEERSHSAELADELRKISKECHANGLKGESIRLQEIANSLPCGENNNESIKCLRCNGAGVLSSQGADVCCPSCGGKG